MAFSLFDAQDCDDNFLPSELISKKKYENCDGCGPVDETPHGGIVDNIAEIERLAEETDKEDALLAERFAACVSKFGEKMSAATAAFDALSDRMMLRAALDEYIDNLRPVASYHASRIKYAGMRDRPQVAVVTLKNAIIAFKNAVSEYTGAVEVETTVGENGEFAPAVRNIISYGLKCGCVNRIMQNEIFISGISTEVDNTGVSPGGVLYAEYYDKLSDPLNGFFSAGERGLTESFSDADQQAVAAAVAAGLNAADAVSSVQGGKTYYVSDSRVNADFFSNFKENYDARISQIYDGKIKHAIMTATAAADIIAAFESAIAPNVDDSLSFMTSFDAVISLRDSIVAEEKEIIDGISRDVNDGVSEMAACTDSAIENAQPTELPPFAGDYADTFKYGEGGLDPSSPNVGKKCYWDEFAKLATLYGTLPFPDIAPKSPGNGMRYWPVGLVIPTPNGMVKIPLPIIWKTAFVVTMKFGVIVIFVGQCGMLPCPFVFYVNKGGSKRFIATMRGMSAAFGYEKTSADNGYPVKISMPFYVAFAEISADMRELIGALPTAGIPTFDEFVNEIKRTVDDAIDAAGLPEFDAVNDVKFALRESLGAASGATDALRSDILKWMEKISLPKVVLPKDPARMPQMSGAAKAALFAVRFASKKFVMPDSDALDFKQYVLREAWNAVSKIPLPDMPQELSFDMQAHWETFKEYLNSVISNAFSAILPNEWNSAYAYDIGSVVAHEGKHYFSVTANNAGNAPSYASAHWRLAGVALKSNYMTPDVVINDPLNCVDSLAVPQFDVVAAAAATAGFAAIRAAIDSLSATVVSGAIGISRFASADIGSVAMLALDATVPSITLPAASFGVDAKSAMLSMTAMLAAFDPPKAVLGVPLGMPLILDVNAIKPALAGAISKSIDKIIMSLPIDIYGDGMSGFGALSEIDVKTVVKDVISTAIREIFMPLKPAYDAFAIVSGAARLTSVEKTAFDQAVQPQEVAVASAIAAAKALTDNFKTSLSETGYVPQSAINAAYAALSLMPQLPYPVIGAIAAFGPARMQEAQCGGGPGISLRSLHPILYEDDLPPWERMRTDDSPATCLSKNFLFTLFLDEFCHAAKQYGGFFENYAP